MSLKIVLLGTGEFALPAFKALMESEHQVVGLFTQPDRTGSGHHRHVNPVKELALSHQIPVFQPPRINQTESLDQLESLGADLFVVAAYGQILKPALLSIPRLGAFNLHGSLLPRHRGAAPVQYSIWKGDRLTGVTIFRIEPELDSGPIAGSISTEILAEETSGELMLRLADLCVPLTLEVVRQLALGTAEQQPQEHSQRTLAPRIEKEQGCIDWHQTMREIDCHIRAMQPWPRAYTWLFRSGQPALRCLILKVNLPVDVAESDSSTVVETQPGIIRVRSGNLEVETSNGWLQVVKIQPEGKKAMDVAAFLNGYPLTDDARFGPGEL